LTLYAGAYLELALRRNPPLESLDAELRRVANQLGVACLPERL
jgi:predicted nucleic acid-binding protein